MNKEEQRSDAYTNYLEHQSDLSLAGIFYNTMSKLLDKNFGVPEFVRKKELIDIVKELDFTGKLDVTGFEDIRRKI